MVVAKPLRNNYYYHSFGDLCYICRPRRDAVRAPRKMFLLGFIATCSIALNAGRCSGVTVCRACHVTKYMQALDKLGQDTLSTAHTKR